MTSQHSPNDKALPSSAAKAADVRKSGRTYGTDDEWAETKNREKRLQGKALREVSDWTSFAHHVGQTVFDLARKNVDLWRIKEAGVLLDRVVFVMAESEDPTLRSYAHPDGSYLIQVSDTYISETIFILQLHRALDEAQSPTDIYVAIAAARFLILSQCLTSTSMYPIYKPSREISRLASLASLQFSIAHELGHVLLGHLDTKAESLEQARAHERRADQCAAALLRLQPAFALTRWQRSRVCVGVEAALLVTEFRRDGLFIRRPSAHEPFDERLATIAENLPWFKRRSPVSDRLHTALKVASDFSHHLPHEWWDLLSASERWTDQRDENQNRLITGIDRILGLSQEVNLENLEHLDPSGILAEGVGRVCRGESSVKDLFVDLGAPRAAKAIDSAHGITRQTLHRWLMTAPAWPEEPGKIRSWAAFVAMVLLEQHLNGAS